MTDNELDLFGNPTSPFDAIRRVREDGSEYWDARDLSPVMGYKRWAEFTVPLFRAIKAAKNTGVDVERNFRESPKVSGTRGPAAEDYELTRYAAYLTAMNGDPNKAEVARAQSYFAIRTREAETTVAVPQQRALPKSYAEALRELAETVEANEQLEAKVAADAPLVEQAQHHRSTRALTPIGDFANDLQDWVRDNGIAAEVYHDDVRDYLGYLKLIIRGNTLRNNAPQSEAIKAGYIRPHTHDFGKSARLTRKGCGYAWDRITKHIKDTGSAKPPAKNTAVVVEGHFGGDIA